MQIAEHIAVIILLNETNFYRYRYRLKFDIMTYNRIIEQLNITEKEDIINSLIF